MDLRLGINLGFAINKYFEPEVWTKVVGETLGLRYVQFVGDMINPFYPEPYREHLLERTQRAVEAHDLVVDSIFTSSFCRVNLFLHPEEEGRKIWMNWYKTFFSMGARLGAVTGGSHFGIYTFDSYENPDKRRFLLDEAIRCWQELSRFAADLGYESLLIEPMSVPREMANTVQETRDLLDAVNANSAIPMRVCLDVGHAPHPDERDPYPWIEALGSLSPIVHLQQTELHASHHWPFVSPYNEKGIVRPEKVIAALERSGCEKAGLYFEIGHREHRDFEDRILSDLKGSVDYWRPYVIN